MPRPADFADKDFKPTIFNRIRDEIAARSGSGDPPVALHVGDTWMDLPPELDQPLPEEPWNERLSRYGDTQGEPELRRRLAQRLREVNGLPVSGPEQIQITFGATGGLFLAMRRLLEPGDEVIALSPHWTIFKVVGGTAGVKVVNAPFFDRLTGDPEHDMTDLVEPHLSDRTRAIYFNNPNNPSGVMLRRPHLEALARFARERDLWIFSDEAYEDFVWVDEPHTCIGSLEGMFERTVSVFSASKSFAAAGLRLGWVAAPTGAVAAMNPAHVGAGYEPPRPAQVRAIRGLERREAVVRRLRDAYAEAREAALASIELNHLPAEGSFYLFVDLRERWAGLDDDQKLDRMLAAGVVLSPGAPFGGPRYEGWARFCYTSEPPDRVAEAARRLSSL